MNREIKLRFWQKSFSGRMFYDENFAITADGKLLCLDSDVNGTGTSGWQTFRDNDDYVIQQFTGLLDKNGVSIYEGDILKLNTPDNELSNGNYAMEYWQGMFVINADRYDDHREDYIKIGYWVRSGRIPQAEVIGNIYENSDLLKG